MSPAVDGVCEECGYDYDKLSVAELPDAIRGFGRKYRAPLTRGLPGESLEELLQAHPTEGVWSALEYACHMRDVFEVQTGRIRLALDEDQPTFESMGREERVADMRYNEQPPEAVAGDLAANAEALASLLEGLSEEQWSRTGIYGYPEPAVRDMRWVARHTVHEGQHHLLDVGRVLRAARGR